MKPKPVRKPKTKRKAPKEAWFLSMSFPTHKHVLAMAGILQTNILFTNFRTGKQVTPTLQYLDRHDLRVMSRSTRRHMILGFRLRRHVDGPGT